MTTQYSDLVIALLSSRIETKCFCLQVRELDQQYFVETVEINRVPKDSIYAVLISTNIVNPDLKTYSVDKTELEEIIFSLSS